MLRKLPLGIHTFSTLRKDNCLYIDKTEHAYNLITKGYRYFLSRPRRFGKSLFVSTLKEILTANKSLFDGLWITQSDYQWKEHGVIALDFSGLSTDSTEDLKSDLCYLLTKIANDYALNIETSSSNPGQLLRTVTSALHKRSGRVALLVDEYDSPILRTLNNDHANAIHQSMQQFFATIKSLDEQINFVFITGITPFTNDCLFFGMDNLTTITLNKRNDTICGYTNKEIDDNLQYYIQAWANKDGVSYETIRNQINEQYGGYRFGDTVTPVCNPFFVLNAINEQKFENFSIKSGLTTLLVDACEKEYASFDPKNLVTSKELLGIFDTKNASLSTLMFQAGYLTITNYDAVSQQYTLGYPNIKTKNAFQKHFKPALTQRQSLASVAELAQ